MADDLATKSVQIRTILRQWYLANKRDLPWRDTPDAYHVWISEIMLQQTRVDQAIPYFLRFLVAFPTLFDLAAATEDQVLRHWQGLGYYARGRALRHAAIYFVEQCGGAIPTERDRLLKAPGIGDYTASAILSIAFNKPFAAVDGNVNRIITRLYGWDEPPLAPASRKYIQQWANELLHPSHPADHNQGMMDFGSLVCTPQQPDCLRCPLSSHCVALKNDLVNSIPRRFTAKARRVRQFHYLVVSHTELPHTLALKRRTENDIWRGLYEFPLVEGPTSSLRQEQIIHALGASYVNLWRINAVKKHVLSHQEIMATFYHLQADFDQSRFVTTRPSELDKFAFSRLTERYLDGHELLTGKPLSVNPTG